MFQLLFHIFILIGDNTGTHFTYVFITSTHQRLVAGTSWWFLLGLNLWSFLLGMVEEDTSQARLALARWKIRQIVPSALRLQKRSQCIWLMMAPERGKVCGGNSTTWDGGKPMVVSRVMFLDVTGVPEVLIHASACMWTIPLLQDATRIVIASHGNWPFFTDNCWKNMENRIETSQKQELWSLAMHQIDQIGLTCFFLSCAFTNIFEASNDCRPDDWCIGWSCIVCLHLIWI